MNNTPIKIYPNFTSFTTQVLDIININENTPIYINDTTFPYANENLYNQLMRQYGNIPHNFNTDTDFINQFPYIYSQSMMSLYIKVTTIKNQNLNDLTIDFYKNISNNEQEMNQEMSNTLDNRQGLAPSNTQFSGLIDELQIQGATLTKANDILKNNTSAFASTENLYRIMKTNEASTFKTLITNFINSFGGIFFSISSGTNSEKDISPEVVFTNGYPVYQVPYLGYSNQDGISTVAKEVLKLQVDVANLGQQKVVWDDVEMVFKMISDFDIKFWDGLTEAQIYDIIFTSGVIWQEEFTYPKDFITQFICESEQKIKWAVSLIPNNKGNNPGDSPLAWKVFAQELIDLDLLINQLKPYINAEISKQLTELPEVTVGPTLVISPENVLDVDLGPLEDEFVLAKYRIGPGGETIIQNIESQPIWTNQQTFAGGIRVQDDAKGRKGPYLWINDTDNLNFTTINAIGVISDVEPGVVDKDAVNMGQLNKVQSQIDNIKLALDGKVVVPGVIESGETDANGVINVKHNDLANIVVFANNFNSLHTICSPNGADYQKTRCSAFLQSGEIIPWSNVSLAYQKWVILRIADLPAHNIKVKESRIKMEQMIAEMDKENNGGKNE